MRFDRRFADSEPPIEAEIRWVERANELAEVLAPRAWTTARVEAWLDWADGLPGDFPRDAPESLGPEAAPHPLLAGGPERHARRLSAWGLALGVFEDLEAAELFRAELLAAIVGGLIAPGPQLPFGARVHPLAGDTAQAPGPSLPRVGGRDFDDAANRLRAGRGLFAALNPVQTARLCAVSEAVLRCAGDASACASFDANQALARAAWAAREAGVSDSTIAEAVALARVGVETGARVDVEPALNVTAVASRDQLVEAGPHASRAAQLGWETSSLTLALSLEDATALDLLAVSPRAAVNVLAFEHRSGFDAEGFDAAVRLAFVALDIEGAVGFCADPVQAYRRSAARPVALGLAGVSELLVARGFPYESDAGRKLAAALYSRAGAIAATTSQSLNTVHALKTAAFDDPEMTLRLGGLALGAAPWSGPTSVAETADGELIRTLAEPAIIALERAGVDIDAVRVALLGHRTLRDAPGIDSEQLTARGFTEHELAAIEAALGGAAGLREAFSPTVIGAGFVRDVLGAPAELLDQPGFDTLAHAGFSDAAVAEAEPFVLGSGSLAGLANLSESLRLAFAAPAEIDPKGRLAMGLAIEAVTCAPVIATLTLAFEDSP
ncbi:MAG: hypothetical protein ACHP7N_07590, partial [Caulobacterales bacterium]